MLVARPGRNVLTGTIEVPDQSRSWLAAIGYLALLDQVSKLLDVPSAAGPKATSFEHLLAWKAQLTPDEAAAVYALRCAFVHSYGLLHDPRDRRQGSNKPRRTMSAVQRRKHDENTARNRQLLHMFELGAGGHAIVELGNPRSAATPSSASSTRPSWTYARSPTGSNRSLPTSGLPTLQGTASYPPAVRSRPFIRACFFMHDDPISTTPRHEPRGTDSRQTYVAPIDMSSPAVSGFDPAARTGSSPSGSL